MSIPFSYSIDKTEKVKAGVKEVKGILSFMDGELLFEYKVYDLQGNALSNLSKFSIQLEHIKRMKYKKGYLFFGRKLILEANKEAFFEPLPGSDRGIVKLNIKRSDKNEAIRFSTKLNLYMSQQRMDGVEK